jgi:hypothetical protein
MVSLYSIFSHKLFISIALIDTFFSIAAHHRRLRYCREREGVGDGKKAWFSINHSILSGGRLLLELESFAGDLRRNTSQS